MLSAPDEGLSFPLAKARLRRDHLRALLQTATVCEWAPPPIVAVGFAPWRLTAQMLIAGAAPPAVGREVLINALLADGGLPCEAEASGNLCGTPLVASECCDLLPWRGANRRAASRAAAGTSLLARLRQLVGRCGPSAAPAMVACQFGGDGGLMEAQVTGHFSWAVVLFVQGVNLESVLAGKLRVTQWVFLLTWRLKQHGC
jgi:hypothetical protein